jgi:hypothetical protein
VRRTVVMVLGVFACAVRADGDGESTTGDEGSAAASSEGSTSGSADASSSDDVTSGSTGTSSGHEETGTGICEVSPPDFATPPSSTLDGMSIVPNDAGVRFDIPAEWISWNERHANNLHLSRAELEAVREGMGEWDTEYALVLATLLDFDQCSAHVGGEGWGMDAVSYGDLQVRAYRIAEQPDELIAQAMDVQWKIITPEITVDRTEPWTGLTIAYDRSYGDYGGRANVELRMRRFGDATAVLAGMYVDDFDGAAEFAALLPSACWDSHADACCGP